MTLTQTAHLQELIDRQNQGDEAARLQLVNIFYERLREIARKKLRYDFPILGGQHSSASIVNEAWIRLRKALDKTQISTASDFLCLAGYKIRLVLLDLAKKIRNEADYFATNAARMKYPKFRKQHLFVGSGVIEAGCKTVIGHRLKQSGMFWSKSGAQNILALRCLHSSRRLEDFWKYRLNQHAARNDALPLAA